MPLEIRKPEIFGVTESSVTLCFDVVDASGPVDARAHVRVGGEIVAVSEETTATRLVRIEGLAPATEYDVTIEVAGAPAPERDRYFPERFSTLPAPTGALVGSFATLNDLHFGEERFGGTTVDGDSFGDEEPGYGMVRATDTEVPYWRFMNDDAVADINAAGVDCAIIKGDIADRGRADQFEAAARTFAGFQVPHHAFLGNHDYYARNEGETIDGYSLLGQEPAPRAFDLGGWRLVLLETADPGEHHGVFDGERLEWLRDELRESSESRRPTILLMHHQPVPPEHSHKYPNSIGLLPEHSLPFFELCGSCDALRGVLIGHTHRNRVRRYPASGAVPFVEVNCTKDHPGGFGHYRLFDDGTFRQEVRRTSSPRALAHSTRCRDFFKGFYRDFSLGPLDARSFIG